MNGGKWTGMTGTHATRLQLLMANPCRLDHMVQSRLASCKGSGTSKPCIAAPLVRLLTRHDYNHCNHYYHYSSILPADAPSTRHHMTPPLLAPPFAIDNTSPSHSFRLLRFEETRHLARLGFKDGAFWTATNLGDLQRLFHRSVDDRHAMGALSPKSIYTLA